MARYRKPHGNIAHIEGRMVRLKERVGTRLSEYVVKRSKAKAMLLGDVYITSSVANGTASIAELRRQYRDGVDKQYPITAHIFAAGIPTERVEMSLASFNELLARLVLSDPGLYLRKHHNGKDQDE